MRCRRILAACFLLPACTRPARQVDAAKAVETSSPPPELANDHTGADGDLTAALKAWSQQHLASIRVPKASFQIVNTHRIPRKETVLVETEVRTSTGCTRELHALFFVDHDGQPRIAEESLYAEDCCVLDAPCRSRSPRGWMYYFARQQELGNEEALRQLVDPERGLSLTTYFLGMSRGSSQTIQKKDFSLAVLGTSWGLDLQSLKYVSCGPSGELEGLTADQARGAWTCGEYEWRRTPHGTFLEKIHHGPIPGQY